MKVTSRASRNAGTRLVAITGGSGSGKTWLATQLQWFLGGRAARLSLDDFYRDRSHLSPARRAKLNFDHPRAIDWDGLDQVLQRIRQGKAAGLPVYDFNTHTRAAETLLWTPVPIVLVEGLWLLGQRRLREHFDISIYLECPEQLRFQRRLKRDVRERGRTASSVTQQFRGTVGPMHDRHVAPQERWADVVLHPPISVRTARELAERISCGAHFTKGSL